MSETRTYRGGSLEELLPRIRAELGEDAVVVRQREGLAGGVAGFFQKRTVEIEARPGQSSAGVEWFADDPEEEAVVTPSHRFTGLPGEGEPRTSGPAPEGQEPAPQPQPLQQAPPPAQPPQGPPEQAQPTMAEVLRPAPEPEPEPREVAASAAVPAPPPPPAGPPPMRSSSPFAAYLNAAAAHPHPSPSPADDGVPESVPSAHAGDVFADAEELMRDAMAQSRADEPPAPETITTSPLVDAIPVPEPEPEPLAWEPPAPPPPPPPRVRRPEPEPVLRAVPEPPPPPRPAGPIPRPQAARHLVSALATRGLDPDLAGSLVDDALLHRLPLEPVATLPGAVAAQLAARIPVAHLSGAAERVLVLAGAAGAGGPRLVAGVAGAYASRTTVEVACIALRTPDGGRALAAALAPIGVPVHTAHDGEQAATHIRNLGHKTLVVVDTPPVTPEDAGALAGHLAALGPHELHLALGPGGGPTAPALIAALRPARLALGDPSDPLHLGAVLQAAIGSACPITFVAASDAMGRPDLAVHPADAHALARALTA